MSIEFALDYDILLFISTDFKMLIAGGLSLAMLRTLAVLSSSVWGVVRAFRCRACISDGTILLGVEFLQIFDFLLLLFHFLLILIYTLINRERENMCVP